MHIKPIHTKPMWTSTYMEGFLHQWNLNLKGVGVFFLKKNWFFLNKKTCQLSAAAKPSSAHRADLDLHSRCLHRQFCCALSLLEIIIILFSTYIVGDGIVFYPRHQVKLDCLYVVCASALMKLHRRSGLSSSSLGVVMLSAHLPIADYSSSLSSSDVRVLCYYLTVVDLATLLPSWSCCIICGLQRCSLLWYKTPLSLHQQAFSNLYTHNVWSVVSMCRQFCCYIVVTCCLLSLSLSSTRDWTQKRTCLMSLPL